MRGSGKSTLGKLLAAKLGKDFIDLDDYIEKSASGKIAELVREHGWDHFRELEKKAAQEMAQKDNLVIATGGGTFLDPENTSNLKKNGFVILLTADIEKLAERIEFDENRPPLTDHKDLIAELKQLWKQRKEIYLGCADLTYDTSQDLDPTSKVDELMELIALHPACMRWKE